MFTIVGQYHMSVTYVIMITLVVLASHTIFMVGRYHMYIVYVITLVVPADHYSTVYYGLPVPYVCSIFKVLVVITYVVFGQ